MRKFLNILPFLFVFIASLYNSADLDLGWHLKYGEHFLNPPAGEQRVLKVNTLSSEMTDYRYPNTSWTSDVVLYAIFSKFNFFGLTILGAAVITLTFYFFSKAANLTLFQQSLIFPLLIYLLAPQNAAGYRAQLLSFLFLGILLYILTRHSRPDRESRTLDSRIRGNDKLRGENDKKMELFGQLSIVKCQLLIVPLFLLWANSHGEYLTGLAVFAIFIGIRIFTSITSKTTSLRSNVTGQLSIVLIFLLSIAATLINPFGINIYLESLRHFNNPLQKYVIEWLPFPPFSLLWWKIVIVAMASATGFFILVKRQLSIVTCQMSIVTLLFLALSFWSRRYAWASFYFSIFLISPLITKIEPRNQKTATTISAIFMLIITTVTLTTKLPLSQFTNMNWDKYCLNYVECSPKSVKFLQENKLGDNLYTLYDWGGYIISNSNIKPSMDGRMALWRDQNNYSAFEKYYALQQNWQDIDKSDYNTVLINHKKPLYLHLLDLTKEGKWQIGYQDEIATVFVRKNAPTK